MRHVLVSVAAALLVCACGSGGSGAAASSPSCASAGHACGTASACCTGACEGGVCAPSVAGEVCVTSADCYPPMSCASGKCANPGCLADGAACSLDGRCCAMNCRGDGTCGANRAPVAAAGADGSIHKGETVTLDGSASHDPDGDRVYLSWTLSRPPGSYATLSSATAQKPTFYPDARGTYVATLTVTDGDLTSGDSVALTVVNRPPVADIGASRTVQRRDVVLVNGDPSTDPDGDILTYAWSFARPPGSAVNLEYAGAPYFRSVWPDVAGDYVVTLAVSDGLANDEATIVITAVNGAPVADIDAYAAYNAGTLVTARGTYSGDPNGDPITYAWQLTRPQGSAAALASTTAEDTSFTPDVPGAYALALTVSDGELSGTTTRQITVYPRVVRLDRDVVDAVYDAAADQIVFASASPYNAICRFSGASQSFWCTEFYFDHDMRAVTVASDGGAAYGRVGYAGWYDGAGWRECPLPAWTDGNGVAHDFEPASVALGPSTTFGSGRNLRTTRFLEATATAAGGGGVVTLDMEACTSPVATTSDPPAGFDGRAALRPGTRTLYALGAGSPGPLWTWDASLLPASLPAATPAVPGAATGSRFWFYGDGSRLVTSLGTVFDAALAPDGAGGFTLPSVGSLGNPGAGDPAPPSVHASHSAAAGRVARIPATGTSATRLDTEVRQYAAGDLSAVGTPLALPPIVDGSTVAPAYGKFVFYDVGGTKLHVVESTEATGYRWGVATLTP